MFSRIGSKSRRTLVIPITLISFLAACYNHTQVDAPYAQALEVKLPKQLRITVGEDSTFKVKEPRLEDLGWSGYPSRAEVNHTLADVVNPHLP